MVSRIFLSLISLSLIKLIRNSRGIADPHPLTCYLTATTRANFRAAVAGTLTTTSSSLVTPSGTTV